MPLKFDYNPFGMSPGCTDVCHPFLAPLQKLHSAVMEVSAPCNQVAAAAATAPSAA